MLYSSNGINNILRSEVITKRQISFTGFLEIHNVCYSLTLFTHFLLIKLGLIVTVRLQSGIFEQIAPSFSQKGF